MVQPFEEIRCSVCEGERALTLCVPEAPVGMCPPTRCAKGSQLAARACPLRTCWFPHFISDKLVISLGSVLVHKPQKLEIGS